VSLNAFDLDYLKRPRLALLRKRLTWVLIAVPRWPACRGARRRRQPPYGVQRTALRRPCALEKRCEVCHSQAFGGVPIRLPGMPRWRAASAHVQTNRHVDIEKRCADATWSIAVASDSLPSAMPIVPIATRRRGPCARCHPTWAKVTAFRPGPIPTSWRRRCKTTALRLNHAVHMPGEARPSAA